MSTTTVTLTHTPCCSAHGVDMDCERYRRTHFVEVGPCCGAWHGPVRPPSPPTPEPPQPVCAPRHFSSDILVVHPNADCPTRRTIAVEAIEQAEAAMRAEAADMGTRDGRYEHETLADWLNDYRKTL